MNEPKLTDPRDGPSSPDRQQIDHAGATAELEPSPDHGEVTHVGTGRLLDRRALVTGGDPGIGRAIALAFAREGADVDVGCLPEEREDAAETERPIESAGRRCIVSARDLDNPDACRALVDRTVNELGGVHIVVNNVNGVAPGPVWTALIPATMPADKVDDFGEETPVGRPAQPAERAPAYVFLASDDSRYITGETISVTGGMLVS